MDRYANDRMNDMGQGGRNNYQEIDNRDNYRGKDSSYYEQQRYGNETQINQY
jgi:hypothetical protein